MTTPSVQSLLRKYQITPRKRLGQHFLAAQPTIEKIAASLEAGPDDIVVEIGSGLGLLTAEVAKRAGHVVAVEKDHSLIEIAKSEFGHIENITWIEGDILKNKPSNLLTNFSSIVHRPSSIKIIGNLPYNISSPILFWMLDDPEHISRAVVMVQREVAMRIVAGPGGKDYGILSVMLQSRAKCKKLFDVSAASFIPPPEVTSSVLRIDFASFEIECGEKWFRSVVKSAFGQRRKTLRNSLLGARALALNAKRLDAALAYCGIDGKRRPETLNVSEFKKLAICLDRK